MHHTICFVGGWLGGYSCFPRARLSNALKEDYTRELTDNPTFTIEKDANPDVNSSFSSRCNVRDIKYGSQYRICFY